jgi:ABC-2 type transport system permease protein
MIRALVRFEIIWRLKVLSTWVYATVLFAAGFAMMLASGGVFRSVTVSTSSERVLVNGPHSLFGTIGIIALFGIFTVAAIFGQAAHQDFGHDTWMLIFTKNVKKGPYLIGRFLGAFAFSAVLFLAIGMGQAAGSIVVAILHPEMLGRTSLVAYLWPYVTLVWPMLFFSGALFFTLAAVTRRMAPVYVGVVVLVLGYLLAMTVTQDVENLKLAGMLDPFGFLTFGVVTRYWTAAEQNRDLVPLTGLLGANRLLWTAVGIGLLALGFRRFRTTVDEHKGKRSADEERSRDDMPLTTAPAMPTRAGWVRATTSLAWMYFGEIFRSAVFWTLNVSGVFFGVLMVLLAKEIFGTSTLPVTYQVLEGTRSAFRLFGLILVTFYAGELVWRERDVRIADIVDATRAPTWVTYVGKIGALFLVAFAIESASAIVALVAQTSRGYFTIEWRLYFIQLFVLDATELGLICVLAFVIQVAIGHKYLAHAVMVLYYVLRAILAGVGVEEPLVRYGSEPAAPYSDMNGYGHLLEPVAWFRVYWWSAAVALLVVGYVLLGRGRDDRIRERLRAGRTRLRGFARGALAAALVVFVSSGAFLYRQTHILSRYETEKDRERTRAAYEKAYRAAFANRPQPKVVGADVHFDIYPEKRTLVAKGTYAIENQSTEPITKVFLNVDQDATYRELRIGKANATTTPEDAARGVRFVDVTLAPGERADFVFDVLLQPHGFPHGEARTAVVENGTFVNNFELPIIGYFEETELERDGDRKSYGLAPKERMAPRDDPEKQKRNYIRHDAHFVSFAATVTTSADQIGIAPGYLEKEWTEGNRRSFRYVMDRPILNFFSVLSARYAVKEDSWNGIALQIFYHPTHTKNLDRMMIGMKDTLAYCTEAFGPYSHRQARIIEFPRYQTFAQSFPNTVPYSEAIGFIARVRENDPDDIDYPYYVTAHEIAHQWWAHQVVGADVRGATMTSESMAQYTALMIMKRKFGAERMRRYLKFELDGYLRGRQLERKKELPLAHNENQQYIHYQKGSIAMYALQETIGEDKVNRALASVVAKWREKGPPYPTSKDLVDAFRTETPPELHYILDDLFETITLYDNRATDAKIRKLIDGTWEVTLNVVTKKLRSDQDGKQTELDFDDWLEVGALDDTGAMMHVEKRKFQKGASEVRFQVPKKPAKVGIDPLNKWIDRDTSDNVTVPGA